MIKWRWWDRFKKPIRVQYMYANLGDQPFWIPSNCEDLMMIPVRAELIGYRGTVLHIWWKTFDNKLVLVVFATGR